MHAGDIKIMNISDSKEKTLTIIHNIYDYGLHYKHSISIIDSDDKIEEGKKVRYSEIARLGNYAATTAYYPELPEIFLISKPTSFEVRKRTRKGVKTTVSIIDS